MKNRPIKVKKKGKIAPGWRLELENIWQETVQLLFLKYFFIQLIIFWNYSNISAIHFQLLSNI